MAWHDVPPWTRKRQAGAVAVERIRRIHEQLKKFEAGEANAVEVLQRIAGEVTETPRKETRNGLGN
jgi:hypothetical protein